MKPARWRPQARIDAADAAAWYAAQASPALELEFCDALQDAEPQVSRFPAAGSLRHAHVLPDPQTPLRFMQLRRSDRFLLNYFDLPTHVEIVRVWNARRGLDALEEAEGPRSSPSWASAAVIFSARAERSTSSFWAAASSRARWAAEKPSSFS